MPRCPVRNSRNKVAESLAEWPTPALSLPFAQERLALAAMTDTPNTSAHPLYDAMGLIRIVSLDPAGRATLEYEARPEMCHSGGVVQGDRKSTRLNSSHQ